jgi:hypothetical protein
MLPPLEAQFLHVENGDNNRINMSYCTVHATKYPFNEF